MKPPAASPRIKGSLVSQVYEVLKEEILNGSHPVGEKLPSEGQLTLRFGVSRTVVREAIAALRSDGLAEPRQGAGVFIRRPTPDDRPLPFRDIESDRISSILEVLELRIAVETEAAALAAARRSPAQEEEIFRCHAEFGRLIAAGQSAAEADFALHVSIAKATNNGRFPEFMTMIGLAAIPRSRMEAAGEDQVRRDYLRLVHLEHGAIIDAIGKGDPRLASDAMRQHLQGSQIRYRAALRES